MCVLDFAHDEGAVEAADAVEFAEQHITPTTIRLSIGVEHIDDIIADLEQAFE